MEILMEERRRIPQIKSQNVEACEQEKKETELLCKVLGIQHPIKAHCFCFLLQRVYLPHPSLTARENNVTYQSSEKFCVS